MNPTATLVELQFPLISRTIPADHGYVIFSAICTLLPDLRIDSTTIPHLAILPILGRPSGGRRLLLNGFSKLTFRVPQDAVARLLPLAGKSLPLPGNSALVLGVPSIHSITPASHLYSRLVTIKVRDLKESAPDYAERFLTAARRMISEMGAPPDCLSLVPRRMPASVEGKKGAHTSEPWLRRTLAVRHKTIAGYAMLAQNLTPEASLALQVNGLGGRRHFGCGVFVNHDHNTVS